MRTTITLPDDLFHKLKAVAADRGEPLANVVRTAVEAEIQRTRKKSGTRLQFPILESSAPGSLKLNNAEIDDLLT